LVRAALALLAATAALPARPGSAAPAAPAMPVVARPESLAFPPLDWAPPRPADVRVRLANGMAAYLVPDRTQPLVQIHVLLRVGPDLDPSGKEGLGALALHLLTRGGSRARTAAEVEDRVAFLGALLESQQGPGGGGMMGIGAVPIGPAESRVSLNLLSKDLDEGLALLRECLATPRFDPGRVRLRKDQMLQAMRRRNDDTEEIEEREWSALTRGAGHWTNRWPTEASIEGITIDDLRAFHRRHVGPRGFLLAVSGDFDRAAMIRRLERAFADWPHPGEAPGPPPAPASPATPGWFAVDKDVNQGRVSFGLIALDRYDPDYVAARVMNDILGGGGFSSRLVNRIRSDEGLAYSVSSRLEREGGVYHPDPWRVTFQTKVRSVAHAISIALEEVRRMRDARVSDAELETAKRRLNESLPTLFETAGAIAGRLALEELTGRYAKEPDYYARVRDRVAAVTAEDVRRVARRLLDPGRMTFLVVGDVDEMLAGDPARAASLGAMSGGGPRRLPLRDPMTLEPIPHP
jgi:zinc protease